ncbi:ABC transporter substrate-binding protein/permease [Kamptonema animale CS-326]|uniref:ABC transporter substrate-binding protein/permease n=1 Tax=Kamptonema TaxID=1501433 RepID=UPI00034A133D|nr:MULTISPECIES: ABC transporter substrate-binding protein/permease [Kamptonema]MDB9512784.1 ABC transporter substrate-binding protein/permease [Kamptonema animale CS-326]
MKRWKKLKSLMVVAIAVAFSLIAIASYSQTANKTLTMATSPDYPPYEFKDTAVSGNEIIGFDVDIAKYITKELGYQFQIIGMDFNGLIPALQAGRADFVMAGMTPTPERKKNVDFSDLYYEAQNTIVANKGSKLTKPEDLAGKKVGVQLGSIQQEAVKKMAGVEVVSLNKIADIIQEVKSNRLTAGIIEDTVAKGYAESNPDLEFNVIPNTEESGSAIAFPKGSRLVPEFNRVLQQMKDNGKLKELATQWFSRPIAQEPTTDQPAATPKFGLDFGKILPNLPFILGGIWVTLTFTLLSAFLGFIWGIVLSLFKISTIKPLSLFANGYTSIFRGTPLILQLTLVYFATPQLTGYNISALQAGVITFFLNSGAYISETIRAGIQAVDKGQKEAAESLGVPYKLMMGDIILPQALKNILPALVNESIALLKDSALVSVIGVEDLLRRATIVGAEKYIYFEPLIFVGIIYYLMVLSLTWGANVLERRLQSSS